VAVSVIILTKATLGKTNPCVEEAISNAPLGVVVPIPT